MTGSPLGHLGKVNQCSLCTRFGNKQEMTDLSCTSCPFFDKSCCLSDVKVVAKAKFQIPPRDDFVKFDECNLQFNEIQFLNASLVAVKVR